MDLKTLTEKMHSMLISAAAKLANADTTYAERLKKAEEIEAFLDTLNAQVEAQGPHNG